MPHQPVTRSAPAFRPTVEHLEAREVPATLYGLTSANQLVRFDSATPATIQSTVSIQGLAATEKVLGMDFRPRTGQLYAVAVDSAGLGLSARLLTVNAATGATAAVGTGFVLPAAAAGAGVEVDFNPTVDLLRVVTTTGVNLRVNPNTGAIVGVDAALNPLAPRVSGAAYDRNFDGRLGASGTTLYAINTTTGQLVTVGGLNQSPSPNTGTLGVIGSLGVGFDTSGSVGFDITARGTAGGTGYATFDVETGAGLNTRLYTIDLSSGGASLVDTVGTGSLSLLSLAVAPETRIAAGGNVGGTVTVELRDGAGALLRTLTPFPGFNGDVRTAVADVNRDSVPDVIVGAGFGGGSHVKVFDGQTGAELYSFFAYGAAFTGGVFVAGGDVTGDGYADIITGAGETGGSHLKVFDGQTGAEVRSLFAYGAAFTGGVRVAAADFDNDGVSEIVTAAGSSGAPHVKVFSAAGVETRSFFAYSTAFTSGVYVAAGDVTGDGIPDIVTGAGQGGGPHVKVFDGVTGNEVVGFFAFDSSFTGGVRVGVGDRTADGRAEVLASPGSGRATTVAAFNGQTGAAADTLAVLGGTLGVYVGGGLV
jgi:hypothetical protein